MPIRTITDKQYKGVSELYRKSDGEVTGYYITYRDIDGKPIKRRVDVDNKDDALLKLTDIKKEIDLEKKGNTMSITLPETIKDIKIKKPKIDKPKKLSSRPAGKTMQEYQEIISAYNGVAVVTLIDIVAFDDINIFYGYETGMRIVDTMQSLIDDTLKEMRITGLFSKYGVETFSYELYHVYADKLCLFIKNDLNHRLLDMIVKELLSKISNHPFVVSGENHIHINATFGATKAEGSVSLIYAEKALHEAKKLQNPYIFHDSYSMSKNDYIVNKVYETLIDNIKEETVTPYFQGIFATADCTVPYKFESLMRLVDRDGHILSPAVFMDKSKEYRLYTQLMSQMIDKVFDVMIEHDVKMSLNLSYKDINHIELCTQLIRKIKKAKIGNRLTVEIVESEQIKDIEMVNEFIFALKKCGVTIALDDFGSGFSNFDMIADLDVDYVKLDGSLVSNIHDIKYKIILENVVKICKDLGIKTTAEFISDESIMDAAKSIGVDFLQGYHLHQPQDWDSTIKTFDMVGD